MLLKSGSAQDRIIHKQFIKIKFADFTQITKECVVSNMAFTTVERLLTAALDTAHLPIRLLGVGVCFAEDDKDATPAEQQSFDYAVGLR